MKFGKGRKLFSRIWLIAIILQKTKNGVGKEIMHSVATTTEEIDSTPTVWCEMHKLELAARGEMLIIIYSKQVTTTICYQ